LFVASNFWIPGSFAREVRPTSIVPYGAPVDQHTAFRIVPGDFTDSRVLALIQHHHMTAHAASPPGSAHALDISGLQTADSQFWTAWDGENLLGMGALKRLAPRHGPNHGEVKSMHTVEVARRRGVARAMLQHIIATARADGVARLSLETGAQALFGPARALYLRHGFVACPPFGAYSKDADFVVLDRWAELETK
jgi:putative acetyltransferase